MLKYVFLENLNQLCLKLSNSKDKKVQKTKTH